MIVYKQLNIRPPETFDKTKSVFAKWQEDTKEILIECLQHDFDLWKVPRFVKDDQDQSELKKFFKDNFALLKEIRIGSIADSKEPPEMNL